ncbi:MAG TPA: prephenate dehydratase domain-containing protein, partial [Aggregicoccus sp.]|nr:prephenate dehydratase domain-containing protein [Aggregicoccus sp.]
MSSPATAHPLETLRERIRTLDTELLDVLAERQQLSRSIAEVKQGEALPLRDLEREQQLLSAHVQRALGLGLKPHYVTRIFHAVMEESLRAQRAALLPAPEHTTVAVLGGEGSYSALAARAYFAGSQQVSLVPCPRFADVLRTLRQGGSACAIVPIENSITGSISAVYDLLRDGDLAVVGEHYLEVRHTLLARPGVTLAQVERVLGHPQALAQCETFLQERHLPLEYRDSSADALARVCLEEGRALAAVASVDVAKQHGLQVLVADIASSVDNETRFLILARSPREEPHSVACKTSLLFSTWQRP